MDVVSETELVDFIRAQSHAFDPHTCLLTYRDSWLSQYGKCLVSGPRRIGLESKQIYQH